MNLLPVMATIALMSLQVLLVLMMMTIDLSAAAFLICPILLFVLFLWRSAFLTDTRMPCISVTTEKPPPHSSTHNSTPQGVISLYTTNSTPGTIYRRMWSVDEEYEMYYE